jgi:hypothetical protein
VAEVYIDESVLAILTADERRKFTRLPKWAREKFEEVVCQLEEAQADLEDKAGEAGVSERLAGLWGDIAIRRMHDSDSPGYLRACRAAALLREGVTCATGQP